MRRKEEEKKKPQPREGRHLFWHTAPKWHLGAVSRWHRAHRHGPAGQHSSGAVPARSHTAKPLWRQNCAHVCKDTTTKARRYKKWWQRTYVSSTGEWLPEAHWEMTLKPKLKYFRGTKFLCWALKLGQWQQEKKKKQDKTSRFVGQGTWSREPGASHPLQHLRAPIYVFTPLASQITEFNTECCIQYSILKVQVLMEQFLYLAMFLLRPQFGNKDHSIASLEQDKKATFSPCKIWV